MTMTEPILNNSRGAVGAVEIVSYDHPDDQRLTADNLEVLLSRFDNDLGLFTNRAEAVETFILDGNFELSQGHHFITRSPNGTQYELRITDAGALDPTTT